MEPAAISADTLRTAARAGLEDAAQHLAARSDSFGLPAWRKWARLLTDTRNAKAWPNVFADQRGLAGALLAAYEGIEPVGSDGGHLRGLYADFLDEAAALLDAPRLAEAASAYRALAERWHALAELALPADVPDFATLREELAAVHESVIARGDAGAAEAAEAAERMWALRAELDAAPPVEPDFARARAPPWARSTRPRWRPPRGSRAEALAPPPFALSQVVLAVVEAVGAALPELDRGRAQEVAAPVVRPRHRVAVLAVELGEPLVEHLAAGDHRPLLRRPRAEPRAAAAGGEVGVGLAGGQPLDRPLGAQLALQDRPPQRERGDRVGVELAALAAAVVGEEADPSLVDAADEHEPHRRAAVGRRGRERPALGLGHASGGRLLEPRGCSGEGVGMRADYGRVRSVAFFARRGASTALPRKRTRTVSFPLFGKRLRDRNVTPER